MKNLLFLFFTLFSACSAMPGGSSTIPVTDKGVMEASGFAFNRLYNSNTPASYKILSATQQVVAGIKYHVVLGITPQDSKCYLLDIEIVNHFGEFILLTHNQAEGDC